MNDAKIILADGSEFDGLAYNLGDKVIAGEFVFNTGMVGYEESLTDPSYKGQILVFTYPIIGNYGVGDNSNWESDAIQVKAVVCENILLKPEHYAMHKTFLEWLSASGVVLITGVDTRELTKVLRTNGMANGVISKDKLSPTSFTLSNLVNDVSTKEVISHGNGKHKIILVDCGVKANIIRALLEFDVTVWQVPYNYDYTNEDYDGVLLSNGPGDPKDCVETIDIAKKAMQKNKPIFGICLGSQIMGLSIGANTYKLKFGHRGHNQPCIDVETKRCYLTSQNHGYAICDDSLPSDWQVTFLNLNDNTIAGIRHKSKPFSSVQFHPEAAAGPECTRYLFTKFINQVVDRHI